MESENSSSKKEYHYTPIAVGVKKSGIARRSRMVSRLKWFLIFIAVALLIALIVMPVMHKKKQRAGEFHFVFPLANSDDLKSPRLVKPRLYGTDKYNRPYSITADKATEKDNGNIFLQSLFSEITLKNNRWVSIISDEGFIHMTRKTLDVFGHVHITLDDGSEMRTSSAHFNTQKGSVTGVEPVDITGPLGTLKANGFVIEGNGAILRFDGRVKMVLRTEFNEEE